MLGTGQSRHNTHTGQTTVREGDMLIDGSLKIKGSLIVDNIKVNSLTIGNPPYTLPTAAGTDGQIIKMNPDGTTSDWYDLPTGGGNTTQIGSAELNTINVGGGTTGQGLIPSFQGTRDLNINDFSVGGSYVIEAQGPIQYFYDGTSPSVVNSFRIKLNTILTGANNYNLEIDNFVDGTISDGTVQGSAYFSFWRYRAVITKTTTNQVHISTKAEMSKFSNPQDYRSFNQVAIFAAQVINFTLDPTLTLSFTLQCDNLLGAGTTTTFINPSIIWYVAQLGQVNPPQLLTNDHTQLTNLNIGDAGHTQFALLQGRNGGQILSGGILPIHNLTLKAHNIGTDNIIIRDLNSEFKKNINMDNNSIEGVNDINNNLIQFNSVGNSIKLNSNPTENINITADGDLLLKSINSFLDIDSNIIRIISTGTPQAQIDAVNGIELLNNLNMSSNNILNAGQIGCDKIDGANGFLDFNATAGTPPITIPAMELKTNPGGRLNIIADAESINIQGTTITNKTDIQQFLDSGNNALLTLTPFNIDVSKDINMNNNNINSSNFIYSNRIIAPDYETTTGFMTFFGLGSYIPSFTGSGLDMNNGDINNVSKINNLSINGGLSSGTSNSPILTTSTAEQSIAPSTFIGSRSSPANSFIAGDTFKVKLTGNFSSSNGDDLTIRLKGGVSSVINLSTIIIPLNASSNVFFNIDIDFNIRSIGSAGVATLISSFNFTYNQQSGGNYQGEISVDINNSNFDTTIDNDLDITAQFSSNSASNSIETIYGVLHKVY